MRHRDGGCGRRLWLPRLPVAVALLLALVSSCAAPGTAREADTAADSGESLLVITPVEPAPVAGPDSAVVEPAREAGPDSTVVEPTPVAGADSAAVEVSGVPAADRIVVNYFHRTLRCDTCLKFEAYSEEALRTSFPDELAGGRVVWRVLNLDDAENGHYEEEYDLFESSLVVIVKSGGRVVDWKKLEAIWGFVQDKPVFLDYVALEVEKSLRALSEFEPPVGAPRREK